MSDATLRVIRKLLSRAESTDFESEREACLAKVADLTARHAIEDALVWASDDTPEVPTERTLVVPSPYAARKVSLFGAVGAHADCTVIDLGTDDSGVRRVAAVGFPSDLDRMEVLTTSLLVQLTRSMLAGSGPGGTGSGGTGSGGTGSGGRSAGATAAWRRSFITGFAWRVSERLAAARRAAAPQGPDTAKERPGATSVAVVLADRHRAVQAEVRRRYPYLRSRRTDGGSSRQGHMAGRDAGERAGLGETALRGARALPA